MDFSLIQIRPFVTSSTIALIAKLSKSNVLLDFISMNILELVSGQTQSIAKDAMLKTVEPETIFFDHSNRLKNEFFFSLSALRNNKRRF